MSSPRTMLGLRLIKDPENDFSIFTRCGGLLDVACLRSIRSVPLGVVSIFQINHV